jgi:hypothetical protein
MPVKSAMETDLQPQELSGNLPEYFSVSLLCCQLEAFAAVRR